MNEDELSSHKEEKRNEYEGRVKKQRFVISKWIDYARWEESV